MRTCLSVILICAGSWCHAQSGYKIQVKVQGWQDTTAYLGYYHSESPYLRDTARVNSRGEFVFTGNNTLAPGVYFVVLNSVKMFELVVGSDQQFALSTRSDDYTAAMKVSGDDDNRLFFEDMAFERKQHEEAAEHIKLLHDTTATPDARKKAQAQFDAIRARVLAYQNNIIARHPQTVAAAMFKALHPLNVPAPPVLANGHIDSTYQLRWYRKHFFDNFDLSNEALLQMPRPLYREKLDEYLDKLFPQQVDTLTEAIHSLLARARKNKETYKYAILTCILKYQDHRIMGLDEVYVNLYDRYFASGEMDYWVTGKLKQNLKAQADRFRKSLVGNIGANLIMLDSSLRPQSMYAIASRYTVLYIFDPDCGRCREETPKLVEVYKRKKTDMQVYAVSLDTSMTKMRDYIRKMDMQWITVNGPRTLVGLYSDHYDAIMTPTLYVLDDRKRIIAKNIPIEALEDFLTEYEDRKR